MQTIIRSSSLENDFFSLQALISTQPPLVWSHRRKQTTNKAPQYDECFPKVLPSVHDAGLKLHLCVLRFLDGFKHPSKVITREVLVLGGRGEGERSGSSIKDKCHWVHDKEVVHKKRARRIKMGTGRGCHGCCVATSFHITPILDYVLRSCKGLCFCGLYQG